MGDIGKRLDHVDWRIREERKGEELMENLNKNEKNCLNCLHCKLINKHKELRCKAGMWIKINDDERFIKLIESETRTLNIRPREIFHLAKRCQNLVEMD